MSGRRRSEGRLSEGWAPEGWGTLVRGLRSRALLSGGTVLLVVLAVASAVLGPAFASQVGASFLVRTLAEAPPSLTGVSWSFSPRGDAATDPALAQESAASAAAAVIAGAGDGAAVIEDGAYGEPTTTLLSDTLSALNAQVDLLAATDACAHLTIRGRCPGGPDEVLLLARDAAMTGLHRGDTIDIDSYGTVTVVGTYAAPGADEEDFWFDTSRFSSAPPSDKPTPKPYRPAPFVTVPAAFEQLTVAGLGWSVLVDSRLDPPADLTVDDLPALLAVASAGGRDTEGGAPSSGADAGTVTPEGTLTLAGINDLTTVTQDVVAQQGTAAASLAPAVLSLVLVALALLLRLLGAAADLRTPEIALATLRGLPRRRLWALGLGEPLVLLAVAAPLGAVLGVLATVVLDRAWLVPGLPLRVPLASVLSALAVSLGALLVAAVSLLLVLRSRLDQQLAGVRRPGPGRRVALVAQLALLAAAVAVTLGRLTAADSDPDLTDLVLPVLLAAVAGLAATQLTQRLARLLTRRRRGSGALGRRSGRRLLAGWVAVRTLSRRREGTLVVLPLTAAIAISVFAAGVHDSAADWRASVAATRAPADEVWSSQLGLERTVALTHRLDPDGQWLMAAGTVSTTDGSFVAMDTARLARVGLWPSSWTPGTSTADVAAALETPGTVPEVTGRTLTMTVTDAVTTGDDSPLVLRLDLSSDAGVVRAAYSEPLRAGRHTVRLALTGCGAGCRLEGLTVGTTAALQTPMAGSLTIEDLQVDGAGVGGWLGDARWAVSPDASSPEAVRSLGVAAGDDGALEVGIDTDGEPAIVQLSTGGVGSAVPAVSGVDAPAEPDAATVRSHGGIVSRTVLTAASLPLSGPVGRLVDIETLTLDRVLYDQGNEVVVLARADTPDDVRAGLLQAGVTEDTTYAQVKAGLDATPYALALRLYAIVAALVLLMALAALAVSTAVQLPARRRDAAGLRVVGVPRATVARAVLVELGVVLGGTAVAGLLAGTAAQVVVLRTLTLGYVDAISTPALTSGVGVLRLLVLAGAATVVLGGFAVVSAVLTVRGARGATLREDGR
ncbi:FtsX-like permease family protein [Nocardioides sp. GY 10127]|uniref:FtsX-like permease family protein n=1 Tax=Nocardioides sp. GY 10127 TaxID=2569762 RepID=UPI0010A92096|nr:FtsX-like permease family protein [Nocardioides sp. GY 10127]TIC82837.1 FtsX-like permease family protein [Nocardioides sp. GY 10127]